MADGVVEGDGEGRLLEGTSGRCGVPERMEVLDCLFGEYRFRVGVRPVEG